jgi:hypothetical protein
VLPLPLTPTTTAATTTTRMETRRQRHLQFNPGRAIHAAEPHASDDLSGNNSTPARPVRCLSSYLSLSLSLSRTVRRGAWRRGRGPRNIVYSQHSGLAMDLLPFGGEASAASSTATNGASPGFSTPTFHGVRLQDQ